MIDQVIIKYPNGSMTVNMEKFFPASKRDCKRLLSIVEMDLNHRDEIIESIRSWMTKESDLCFQAAKEYANRYVDIKPKIRETEEKIQSMKTLLDRMAVLKKKPEYKKTAEKLKEMQKEYRYLKHLEHAYNSLFKYNVSRQKRLKINLEVLP
jgi:hypothetical protein